MKNYEPTIDVKEQEKTAPRPKEKEYGECDPLCSPNIHPIPCSACEVYTPPKDAAVDVSTLKIRMMFLSIQINQQQAIKKVYLHFHFMHQDIPN